MILSSLVTAYERQRAYTLAMPHLGIPGAEQGKVPVEALPPPPGDVEITTKTKDPYVIGVSVKGSFRPVRLVSAFREADEPGRISASYTTCRATVADLVARGVHPLDVVCATVSFPGGTKEPPAFVFRTAVDHLFWTRDDQLALDHMVDGEVPPA